jgi:thymidylate kinase
LKFPVFIIEGPDCAGKTTLANKLAKHVNGKVIHATYRFKGRMGLYHWALLRKAVRMADHSPVIMDRFWMSEIAYGNTYRNGPEPGYEWRELNDWAKRLGFSYSFAVPYRWDQFWEFLQKNYHNQEQLYKLDENRLRNVWQIYRDMALDFMWDFPHDTRVVRLDVTCHPWHRDNFHKTVVDFWKKWRNHTAKPEQLEFIKTVDWRDIRPSNMPRKDRK